MKKAIDLARLQHGQALVIIAAVFVGMLVLAGLAIDGGNAFVERRRAQNAADAAAVAGTHLIALAIQTCDPIDMPALDAKIECTINDYAERNGISDTNGVAGDEINDNVVGYYIDAAGTALGRVGQIGALPLGASGVRVEVKDTHQAFFTVVVGIDQVPSSAHATALTGRVNQLSPGAGILPIAVPQIVVEQLEPNQEWEMHDALDGEFCYTDAGGTEYCIEDPGAPQNAQRGWLNLNHIFNNEYLLSTDALNRTFESAISNAPCPNKPGELPGLAGYASGQCPYAYPIMAGTEDHMDGDFIHGTSGARESSVKAVYRGFAGQTAYAPIFDRAYLREEMVALFDPQAAAPDGYPNGGGFSSAGGGSGDAYYYHIVGYVAVTIGEKPEKHVVYGEFEYAVYPSGGVLPTGYTGTCSPMLHGISLWD